MMKQPIPSSFLWLLMLLSFEVPGQGSCASPDGAFKDMPGATCSCLDGSCGGDCTSCLFGSCITCPCKGPSNYTEANNAGLCYNSLSAGTYCYTYIQSGADLIFATFQFNGGCCSNRQPSGGTYIGSYSTTPQCSAETFDKNCNKIGSTNSFYFGTGNASINAGDKITLCLTVPDGCSVCPVIRCGSSTSVSDCGISSLTFVPVKLLYIRTKRHASYVELSWETATEINNDYYTIERSRDGKNFEVLAMVKGAGNSSIIQSYSYINEAPFMGVYYFRIHQTDFDGKTEYIGMAVVREADEHANRIKLLNVYPNPAVRPGQLHYTYVNPAEDVVKTEVYDFMGTLLYAHQSSVKPGSVEQRVDVSPWSPGAYQLKVCSSYGYATRTFIVR